LELGTNTITGNAIITGGSLYIGRLTTDFSVSLIAKDHVYGLAVGYLENIVADKLYFSAKPFKVSLSGEPVRPQLDGMHQDLIKVSAKSIWLEQSALHNFSVIDYSGHAYLYGIDGSGSLNFANIKSLEHKVFLISINNGAQVDVDGVYTLSEFVRSYFTASSVTPSPVEQSNISLSEFMVIEVDKLRYQSGSGLIGSEDWWEQTQAPIALNGARTPVSNAPTVSSVIDSQSFSMSIQQINKQALHIDSGFNLQPKGDSATINYYGNTQSWSMGWSLSDDIMFDFFTDLEFDF
jgi:hypothetical protein